MGALACADRGDAKELTAADQWGQLPDFEESYAHYPMQYVARRGTPSCIDGDVYKDAWNAAPWSSAFGDIRGEEDGLQSPCGDLPQSPRSLRSPRSPRAMQRPEARMKMLWDDTFLYIAAILDVTESSVGVKNISDFEVFIDTTGSCHNYRKVSLNSMNDVIDILLSRPYDDNGCELSSSAPQNGTKSPWRPKHQYTAARKVPGSLQPAQWCCEMALSHEDCMRDARAAPRPVTGDFWHVNFSRTDHNGDVQLAWSPQIVWSPVARRYQGKVNMHMPDAWGYVVFADENGRLDDGSAATTWSDPSFPVRHAATCVYYAAHTFLQSGKGYQPNNIGELHAAGLLRGAAVTDCKLDFKPAGPSRKGFVAEATSEALPTFRYFKFVATELRSPEADSIRLSGVAFRYRGVDVPMWGARATNPTGSNPPWAMPENAIDGIAWTNWIDFNKGALIIGFAMPVSADQFSFMTAGTDHRHPGGYHDCDPISWRVEGSNNKVSWVSLHQADDFPTPSDRCTQTEWFPLIDRVQASVHQDRFTEVSYGGWAKSSSLGKIIGQHCDDSLSVRRIPEFDVPTAAQVEQELRTELFPSQLIVEPSIENADNDMTRQHSLPYSREYSNVSEFYAPSARLSVRQIPEPDVSPRVALLEQELRRELFPSQLIVEPSIENAENDDMTRQDSLPYSREYSNVSEIYAPSVRHLGLEAIRSNLTSPSEVIQEPSSTGSSQRWDRIRATVKKEVIQEPGKRRKSTSLAQEGIAVLSHGIQAKSPNLDTIGEQATGIAVLTHAGSLKSKVPSSGINGDPSKLPTSGTMAWRRADTMPLLSHQLSRKVEEPGFGFSTTEQKESDLSSRRSSLPVSIGDANSFKREDSFSERIASMLRRERIASEPIKREDSFSQRVSSFNLRDCSLPASMRESSLNQQDARVTIDELERERIQDESPLSMQREDSFNVRDPSLNQRAASFNLRDCSLPASTREPSFNQRESSFDEKESSFNQREPSFSNRDASFIQREPSFNGSPSMEFNGSRPPFSGILGESSPRARQDFTGNVVVTSKSVPDMQRDVVAGDMSQGSKARLNISLPTFPSPRNQDDDLSSLKRFASSRSTDASEAPSHNYL